MEKNKPEMNTAKNDIVHIIGTVGNSKNVEELNSKDTNDEVQNYKKKCIINKIPDTWLRVYPASSKPGEPIYSIIFRCIVCQLGLAAVLILWTLSWIFVINSFEGPYETKVSSDFEREQNQLVIDLATELRQITPLSSKWRSAIEKRIEDERYLTTIAVTKGVRVEPGCFWNLPGTCLFTVYVLTALGFGAPVPHTVGGRTSALVYAVLAVPTHVYLMVNASTCFVVHVEACMLNLQDMFMEKKNSVIKTQNYRNDNLSSNRNSVVKPMNNFRKNIKRILRILLAGRCLPLAAILYYTFGTIIFGLLRDKRPLEIIMFPLEFTTTGGLERVEGCIRILYAFYVEGAMSLLACALATLRRRSGAAVSSMTEKYRLFTVEK